jgi:glycosyltransferase involved in cell wall biosynthesis
VIAISDHAYEQLTTWYRLDEDKVDMIPHGVDTKRFYPREEQHPTVNEAKTTLLYVGRLGARKGLDLVFRALARVDDEDVEFLIAGTGRHEETLRKLARELEITNQVRFLGYVADEELPVLYSSADVFVLPSKYEGFGLVLLEAIACGTPVIGADAGGIPTAVENDETGLIVPRTVENFIEAIELMADRSLREEYAEKAYTKRINMSWQSVVYTVEDIYRDLIFSKL